MITQIDVGSENPFVLPIAGATPKDSLIVRKITGLDPPKLDLFIGDYATDGGTFQGRRAQKRNVVFNFGLNPNPALGETVSGLRDVLYRAFLDPLVDAEYLQISFHDDQGGLRYVVGYAETFEADIFSPDTGTQISLICPDPYIRDAVETKIVDTSGWSSTSFVYQGTAETGLQLEIHPNVGSSLDQLKVQVNSKMLEITGPFSATDDVIYINTNYLNRAVLLGSRTELTAWRMAHPTAPTSGPWLGWGAIAPIASSSLLSKLTAPSIWLQLHSQSNELKVYEDVADDGAYSAKRIGFTAAYWGM